MPDFHIVVAKYCPILTDHTSMERLFIQGLLSDYVEISISKRNYTYDWFCGPGSHMWLDFNVRDRWTLSLENVLIWIMVSYLSQM